MSQISERARLLKRIATVKHFLAVSHPRIQALHEVSQAFFEYKFQNRLIRLQNSLEDLGDAK